MTTNFDLSAAASKVSQALASSGVSSKAATAAAPAGTAATQASTGVSSNDFLTLLVTEMKNQDPTQPTDPSAYIQQLVGVNSLQQLIAINQDLTPTTTSTSGTSTSPVAAV